MNTNAGAFADLPSGPFTRGAGPHWSVWSLMALLLALGGLCVWQARVQDRLTDLAANDHRLREAAEQRTRDNAAQARNFGNDITRLEAERKALEAAGKSNAAALSRARADLSRARLEGENLAKGRAIYEEAVARATGLRDRQDKAFEAQAAALKTILAERDELTAKYTNLVAEYAKANTELANLQEMWRKERESRAAAAKGDKK